MSYNNNQNFPRDVTSVYGVKYPPSPPIKPRTLNPETPKKRKSFEPPPFTITPVASLVMGFKNAEQSTLTQIFGQTEIGHKVNSPIDLSSSDGEDDDFVQMKKPRTIGQFIKRMDSNLAQVGDIVIITARNLKHPRLLFGDIDHVYVFFGIVKACDLKTVDVSWSDVEVGHKKARVLETKARKC